MFKSTLSCYRRASVSTRPSPASQQKNVCALTASSTPTANCGVNFAPNTTLEQAKWAQSQVISPRTRRVPNCGASAKDSSPTNQTNTSKQSCNADTTKSLLQLLTAHAFSRRNSTVPSSSGEQASGRALLIQRSSVRASTASFGTRFRAVAKSSFPSSSKFPLKTAGFRPDREKRWTLFKFSPQSRRLTLRVVFCFITTPQT